jgi:hypothetical protein
VEDLVLGSDEIVVDVDVCHEEGKNEVKEESELTKDVKGREVYEGFVPCVNVSDFNWGYEEE